MSENEEYKKERYISEDAAKAYARYRPSYRKNIVDIVTAFCDDNSIQRDTVVDVGCGSGQSAFHWADHFNKCLGIDMSHNQIACAQDKLLERTLDNVEFKVGTGEELPLPDHSVDMLSFGTCWHWMNYDKVIPEIHRVLKAPGCVAIYANQLIHPINPQCDHIYQKFIEKCVLPYFSTSQYLYSGYRNAPLPYTLEKRHDFTTTLTYTLDEFSGLIRSFISYKGYLTVYPEATDLEDMIREFEEVLPSGDKVVEASYPVCALLFKNS